MRAVILAIGLSLCVSIPAAGKTETSVGSFSLTAFVPTVCRIEVPSAQLSSDQRTISFGTITRLCNDRNGYRVTLVHPSGLEGARFVLGGRNIALSSGAETEIVAADRPEFTLSDASLIVPDGAEGIQTLAFRIEAKGPRY